MKIQSTPHAHTTFVDGRSSAREMALAAFERGFVSMGFSEHATQRVDQKYALPYERETEYIETVRALAREYDGRMKIWLGIERDRLSDADVSRYEYILGASHYIYEGDGDTGMPYAVDGDPERLYEIIARRFRGDTMAFCRTYYEQLAAYIVSVKPQIIAHFDLVSKNNRDGCFFCPTDPHYIRMVLDALEMCFKTGALLELNTGCVVRAGLPAPYPAPFILSAWREMGGRIIVGSDCHLASQIDGAYDRCAGWLRAAGFTSAWRLGQGSALFEEYELDA